MGLDMYLKAKKFVSSYEWSTEAERHTYAELVRLAAAEEIVDPATPHAYIEVTVAYWRKANQIHSWFVRNVQDDRDECQLSYVSREQLQTLRKLCDEILFHHAAETPDGNEEAKKLIEEELPPAEGFFFGSTDIDEWFWKDLESTVTQLDRVLGAPDEFDFYYQSSW